MNELPLFVLPSCNFVSSSLRGSRLLWRYLIEITQCSSEPPRHQDTKVHEGSPW